MPFSPNREETKDTPLTDSERKQKIQELQAEQERTLRLGLGDALFQWLKEFDQDRDVLAGD